MSLSAASSTASEPALQARRRRLSPTAAFVAVAAILVVFLAASAAPSPLYVVYQQAWGFSSTTLTFVFAIYVVGLLGSLLSLGSLSDHVGRKPVLVAAVVLEAIALVFFLVAGNVATLAVARFVQGVATGMAMTTLSAALVDLDPPHAKGRAGVVNSVVPPGALAVGAVACGALVQYAPAPMHLVYAIILGGIVLGAIALIWLPETSSRVPGARESLKPTVSLPSHLRAEVTAIMPVWASSWAIAGLYLSLGASVAAGVFGVSSHLVGGFVVTMLCGTGAIVAYFLRTRPPAWLLTLAAVALGTGMVISLIGVDAEISALAVVGTVVAGVGFGASAVGSFGTLARLAAPHERGGVFAFALVVAYLTFSVPAVIAGFAATSAGLKPTVLGYGAVVVVLCVVALVSMRAMSARRTARDQQALSPAA